MPKRTSDPTYLANRRRLLADNPQCHWCGQPATEADHLIEHDRGGTDDIDNLVPACKTCNARRGNRYKQAKDAARLAARTIATGPTFFSADTPPPTPSFVLSVDNQRELAGTGENLQVDAMIGRDRPRLETVDIGGQSWGHLVATWANVHMGVSLMGWQKHALEGMLMLDDNGELHFREALVSTARQNGKSVLLQAVLGYFLTDGARHRGRPQSVLSVANRLDRAEAIHTALAPILEAQYGAKVTNAVGRKAVLMPDGSKWEVRAATPNLHGGSYDLIVVDELFDIGSNCIDDALRPSMIARPNPLLACFSTAGDEGSAVMIQMREMAVAEIDGGVCGDTYFAEWSMPPGVNPADEQWWGWANPALGTTVTVKALRAASKKESFMRAHLNMWVSARGAWLDAGQWADLQTDQPMPAGGILAVDSSVDDARYVGVRSVVADNKAHVCVEFVANSEDQMWAEIERVMGDQTVQLALTPTLEIHCPPVLSRRTTIVGYGELLKFSSLVRSMLVEGKVTQRGQRTLTEHVCRAVLTKTAQGTVLSSQKSPGPIELARCMVWAIALSSRPISRTKPILAIAP
jgi:Phage Terminase/HNH endonuclease